MKKLTIVLILLLGVEFTNCKKETDPLNERRTNTLLLETIAESQTRFDCEAEANSNYFIDVRNCKTAASRIAAKKKYESRLKECRDNIKLKPLTKGECEKLAHQVFEFELEICSIDYPNDQTKEDECEAIAIMDLRFDASACKDL
ncbi:MAG: hypothetical protein H7Y07_10265 [Pyrinomonadaceae bacterium]|nr:hypothetical protein [Sphingobacteriaceae bacterium]